MLAKRGAPTPSLAGNRESQEAPRHPSEVTAPWTERRPAIPHPYFCGGICLSKSQPFSSSVQFKYTFSDRVSS